MSPETRGAVEALLGERVRFDEPMSQHTTLRIGGPADAWCMPASVGELSALVGLCVSAGVPLTAVGGGSNLLVRDGGIRGVVLSSRNLRGLERMGETSVRVEAGVSTGKLLAEVTRWELGGLEFLGGVPGSVGGGLVMNAGTYLGEFKDVTREVTSVSLIDGSTVTRTNAECKFVYRGSALPRTEVVVEAIVDLTPRPADEIRADVRGLKDRRKSREPSGASNAGSAFKNPEGDYAGRLIEAAGLKGRRVGAAECSPVHANWMVNTGGATASDMVSLLHIARDEVRAQFGVELVFEWKIIGEDLAEKVTNKRVGVLMGGLSSEREVSLGTGRGVLAALEGRGYNCVGVDWTEGSDIAKLLEAAGVEVVWNALHGTYGEDGAIQGLLTCLGIPFTGAGLLACAIAMDKEVSKQIFRHRGVPTPPGVAARSVAEAREVGIPCVVKPAREGSSVGVTVVTEESALEKAFELAQTFDGPVLVEEFIDGAELHVGILRGEVLGSVEVRPAAGFYDYEAKYKRNDTQYISPPEVDPHALDAAEAVALAAYRALGCESYGRVDVRLAGGSRPMVLEVNCLPGMTETSLLPKIAAAAGIDYATLCERILADAVA